MLDNKIDIGLQLMEIDMKKRINYLDIAKGIGMLCVIAGHMGINKIAAAVHPFHMPMFFLISGYLLDACQDMHMYIRRKMRQLLIPYIFTCMGVCILSVLKSCILLGTDQIWEALSGSILSSFYGAGVNYNLPYPIKEIGAVWFLLALLWALLIVKFFVHMENGWVYIGIIAYISYITAQYIWLPFSIQAGGAAAVFVYVGFLMRTKQRKDEEGSLQVHGLLIVIGIFLWWFEYQYDFVLQMASNEYPRGLFSVISACLISYVVICIAYFIDKKFKILNKIFLFLGQNSLIVLCFHLLEINAIPWNRVYLYFDTLSIMKIRQYIVVFILRVLFVIMGTMLIIKVKKLINR